MDYKLYSVVKIKTQHKSFSAENISMGGGEPKEGDLATIIEAYESPSLGYELECSNDNGVIEWLAAFSREVAELETI